MALQFRPPTDILALYEQQRQNSMNGLNQTLQTISTDAQRQQALNQQERDRKAALEMKLQELALAKEKNAREQGQYAREYAPAELPGAGGAYNQYATTDMGQAQGPTLTQDAQLRSMLTQGGGQPTLQPNMGPTPPPTQPPMSPVIQHYESMRANSGIGMGQNNSLAPAPKNPQEEANLQFANELPYGIKGEDALTKRDRAQRQMDQKRTFQEKQEVSVDGSPVGYMAFDTRSGQKIFKSYDPDVYPDGAIPEGGTFIPKVEPTVSPENVEFFSKGKTLNQIFGEVNKLYKDDYVGPVAGRVGRAKDLYTPFGDADRSKFRNYVAKAFNNLVYLRSGKQINQEEAVRMAEEFMSQNNSPIAFKSAFGSMEQEMKWLLQNRKSGLDQAGYRGAGGIDIGTSEPTPQSKPKGGSGSKETPEQRKARLIAEAQGL